MGKDSRDINLLADHGYDTDAIILKETKENMISVIPPKKKCKQLCEYDEYLYKLRHHVENPFLLLKRWREIATCYAQNVDSFLPLFKFVALLFGSLFIDDTL